jgi:hypothetical protein
LRDLGRDSAGPLKSIHKSSGPRLARRWPGPASKYRWPVQAAFDNDDLESNNIYGNLAAGFPNLRMLVTTSQLDEALGDLYPKAERLNLFKLLGAPRVALDYGAPTAAVQTQFGPVAQIFVGPGFTGVGLPPAAATRMWIADLTPLHADPTSATFNMPLVGHHTDIFRDEIYSLIAGFIG